jgi:hypothetical protein
MFPEFDYHAVDESYSEDYGIKWPAATPQIIKELKCFNIVRWTDQRPGRICSAYHHLMVAVRLLWPDRIAVAKVIKGKRYDNHYFKAVMKALCEEGEVMLTGPASAGKTCPVAAYNLVCFYSRPMGTTAIVSTTSIKGADLRLWGEIRDLHNCATFKVGDILESFKAITFNAAKETKGKKEVADRDLRDSLTVVAIPPGAEGAGAVRSIIGTKNEVVLWSIDELPEMQEGLLGDAVANLESNMNFQLIGIGNAKAGQNPHRAACEPEGGWDSHDPDNRDFGGIWRTKTGGLCVYLDGEKSPNHHPEFEDADKKHLPFPYLSNPVMLRRNAFRFGNGDIESGKKTLQYYRMCKGIWPLGDVERTVLSASKVRRCGAHLDVDSWAPGQRVTYCGADPAFTSGGDAFPLVFGERGTTADGVDLLRLDSETVHIEIQASSKEEYAKVAAKRVVQECKFRGVEPRHFAIDVSSDGGIIAQQIMKEWGSTEIMLVSSMGKGSDLPVSDVDPRPALDVYDRRVTELWMTLSVGVELGLIRNYNCQSRYARDHFTRLYEVGPGGKLSLQKKDDFRELNRRSPDDGDAVAYLWECARRDGLAMVQTTTIPKFLDTLDGPRFRKESEVDDFAFAEDVYGEW